MWRKVGLVILWAVAGVMAYAVIVFVASSLAFEFGTTATVGQASDMHPLLVFVVLPASAGLLVGALTWWVQSAHETSDDQQGGDAS
jgi:hypothetical protein